MSSPVETGGGLSAPPLALYVHIPWCVSKCPYCDFNSHALVGGLPADRYIHALLADLEQSLPLVWGRPVSSVFLGGGTPSLFSARQIARILEGLRARLQLSPHAEITLEANPGAVEHDRFADYRAAGVNRVSLGVQSFDDEALQRIGRIHGRAEVEQAVDSLHAAGLENFNIDLMFGLPGQTVVKAVADVDTAIQCRPAHLSHYHLTIEANTAFAARPPPLPEEDEAWEMQEQCVEALEAGGFTQYEVSAWARPGLGCRHNLNYWRYGDFLGIGAGAHSKITLPAQARVLRQVRQPHPRAYLAAVNSGDWLIEERDLSVDERVFEFFLNQLRLRDGVRKQEFQARTGAPWNSVSKRVDQALRRGLLEARSGVLKPTSNGWRFLNEIQQIFLPETRL
jgi:oxygen-independent coproporphyrinogen-3 oxidase